ncbi:FHA domain-containing protein [Aggregicoccus sp. 17bor-14]|uniref:FHA domain-containing protein n=1 Tax=Myxococcaceae TaxID=31 RepID=UPI00129D09ED|nr:MULTISPECIES: FHA domain-containing protein [Myxococcaceae]MBF5041013.1 FHA domain-containing protein [Simulacricoccus sp. 17bor-14]MRI86799.1 FHA domain-containing protein [Aggregicoccus sp. 17bor-14]
MPSLLLLTGPSAGLRIELTEQLTLGRSPSCEVSLEDDKVSRRHARIFRLEGQTRICDLGSRNGTAVNGERIEGEAVLLPGDRVQVGATTALYEPPAPAALGDHVPDGVQHLPLAEVLPHVGPEAALWAVGVALLSATSEAMVLRRAAEEVTRALQADRTAALLGGTEGLLTAAVVGADAMSVPRSMAEAALAKREVVQSAARLCAPLVASGGAPFGVLYTERDERPFEAADLRVLSALGRLVGEACAAARARAETEQPAVVLAGSTRPLRKAVEQARRLAAGAEPAVILGPGGSGKRLFARYIHSRSARALGPLVTVDCRQSAALVEEALLGRASAPGQPPAASALLRADGGTLLLLHVEALPRALAERVGRLLERRSAPAPQGGEEPVDLRLVATAPRSPQLLAARGELDGTLARALGTQELEVPPLAERRADVVPLFELFAQRAAQRARGAPPVLTPEARRLLSEYAWPGNVRELELTAERLALVHPGGRVTALHLPPDVKEVGAASLGPLHNRIAQLERDAIAEALHASGGRKTRAAEELGISRPTLDKKISDYALNVERVRRGPGGFNVGG